MVEWSIQAAGSARVGDGPRFRCRSVATPSTTWVTEGVLWVRPGPPLTPDAMTPSLSCARSAARETRTVTQSRGTLAGGMPTGSLRCSCA
ncbi:hypothetical protein ACFPRL_35965 [Pseudoclavibacter helvolus]